jgi:hypothetical protein
MISPVALQCVGSDLATVTVLAQLRVRLGLELDDISSRAVLKAKRLDPDRASP